MQSTITVEDSESVNGYFLTLIIIYVLGLGVALSEHGKPRTGKCNFWGSLFMSGIIMTLIYFAIKSGF